MDWNSNRLFKRARTVIPGGVNSPVKVTGRDGSDYLVSAALWGFVFFGERPGLLTLGGMVLVTAAGLLVAAPTLRLPVRGDSRSV